MPMVGVTMNARSDFDNGSALIQMLVGLLMAAVAGAAIGIYIGYSASPEPSPLTDMELMAECHRNDFAKRSAEAESRRHEGSLPVRADTLVAVSEANRARPGGHAHVWVF